jgi:hypothetical protein
MADDLFEAQHNSEIIRRGKEWFQSIGVLPDHFYFPPFWAGNTEIVTPIASTPRWAQDRIISTPSVREHALPRKRTRLKPWTVGRSKQPLEPFLDDVADDLARHADVAASACSDGGRRS